MRRQVGAALAGVAALACAAVMITAPTARATTCAGTLERDCFDQAHNRGAGQYTYLTDGIVNLTQLEYTMQCEDPLSPEIEPSIPGLSSTGRGAAAGEVHESLGLDVGALTAATNQGISTSMTIHAKPQQITVCTRGVETQEFSLHHQVEVRRLGLSSHGLGWHTASTQDKGTVQGWVPTARRWTVTTEPLS